MGVMANNLVNADPTLQMGLIVLGLLVFSTVIVILLKQAKPEADFSELAQRIRSWWMMAGFFFFSMIVHPDASLVLFAFLSFMALKEYFTLIHTRLEDHRALFWSYLAIPLQYWWVYTEWRAMVVIFIPVYMFLFIPIRMILAGQPKGIILSMSRIHWGLMLFVFCLSHVGFLMKMPPTGLTPGGGKALVLYLVFLTEINDVAQYTWGKLLGGKLFGQRKIAPTISPKKTWEGFFGGVITTTVLAVLLQFMTGFPLAYSIGAGLIISLGGFFGDLVISSLKRDVGVKDSGALIPGHGGMLDRIDSLAYTAPFFFHYVNYFFYRIPW